MGLQSEIKDAVNWEAPTVGLESSLREVIQKLVARNVSALVVKTDDTVVGLVTEYDLIDIISNQKDFDKTRVSEFLSPCELITEHRTKLSPCAQLDESQSVENAIKVLDAAGTHNLLVSGETDKDVGIASIRDLLKLLI
ncbi:MAG: CBS domain-containing protein [Desulfobacterales bacterium]